MKPVFILPISYFLSVSIHSITDLEKSKYYGEVWWLKICFTLKSSDDADAEEGGGRGGRRGQRCLSQVNQTKALPQDGCTCALLYDECLQRTKHTVVISPGVNHPVHDHDFDRRLTKLLHLKSTMLRVLLTARPIWRLYLSPVLSRGTFCNGRNVLNLHHLVHAGAEDLQKDEWD